MIKTGFVRYQKYFITGLFFLVFISFSVLSKGQAYVLKFNAAAFPFLNVALSSENIPTSVIKLENKGKKSAVNIFPNPAPRGTEIKITIPEKGGVASEVYLYNQSGQVVEWYESPKVTGDGMITFTPAVNIPGIYFFESFPEADPIRQRC
ncbi:T9SS type A sorting domain-containing protein [Draconibacterium orientale]|uniref:T9SS type A sorting domain-containing protein n=1 Tax=Draconibacterium orientale TaxID=1168034 RepID=UPI0029C03DC2|nr:T9SS type A sorting domain-containing protein [Draconibacterium orientale]